MTNREWSSSFVMQEFEKKAAELGWMTTNLNPQKKDIVGNPSKSPTGPFRHNPMGDETGLTTDKNPCKGYDVIKETAEDLIGKAHKKSPTVADAMGEGALVENIIEQQKKDIEVATNTPHGALIQAHAELIQSLIKIANNLDNKGKYKEAKKIDNVINKLARPFVNKQVITKEALWPALIFWGLTSLIGTTAAGSGFFSSIRENLPTDIRDLHEVLKTASVSKWYSSALSPSAQKAAQLLEPFISKFEGFSLKDEKDVAKYTQILTEFKPVLNQVGMLISKIELELGEYRWFEFGMDRVTRVKTKYQDVVKDYGFITSKLSEIGYKQQNSNSLTGVKGLQSILVENGLIKSEQANGQMTPDTMAATKNLENWLTEKLNTLGVKKSFKNKIIVNDKLIIEPEKLQEIIKLIKKETSK